MFLRKRSLIWQKNRSFRDNIFFLHDVENLDQLSFLFSSMTILLKKLIWASTRISQNNFFVHKNFSLDNGQTIIFLHSAKNNIKHISINF